MAGTPIAIALVVLSTNLFLTVVTEEDLVGQIWPVEDFLQGDDVFSLGIITLSDCNSNETGGFFDGVEDAVCFVGNIFKTVGNVFITVANWVASVAAFIANVFIVLFAVFKLLVSFFTWNIPGAPVIIRFILTSITGLSLTYSLHDMLRGRG